LISNFRHVVYVVFFLSADSPASELYVPTFRNTLCVHASFKRSWKRRRVPKRRYNKFRSQI